MDKKRDRKQSLYLNAEMLEEVRAHAKRLDRSMSWVVQAVYYSGREKIAALPDANGMRGNASPAFLRALANDYEQ